MGERAERLTAKLRKEFGNVPRWTTAFTQICLEANDSEWDIARKYYEDFHDNNHNLPLDRMLHRRCKKEIGEDPAITETMIHKWISLEYRSDVQVITEYQAQFDKAHPEVRRAKKLLAEIRRDLGYSHMVDESRILRWTKGELTEEMMRKKYENDIEQSKVVSRAKALQYRLGDEVSHKLKVSVPELQNHFRDNLEDDDIVEHYLQKTSKP